jgi:phosphoglycerate dehydrogenase-like enzyme
MLIRRDGPHADVLRGADFELVFAPEGASTMDVENLKQALRDVDAMLASTDPLTRDVLAGSTLRVVARQGVGYDSVDVAAATGLGIVVTTTPGVLEECVAEHTIAMLLCVTRDLVRRDREVRTGVWSRQSLPRMAGKTLGIVGLGRIGKAVVPRAQGLGMHVIAHDPFADEDYARRHNVDLCSLDELLATADVVTLHSPSTPETANLINAKTLAKMKRGAVLINTSRGRLVDEDAVCDALRSGHLLGAALDVFKQEPLPTTSPLVGLDNVLLCTHMGGLDLESVRDGSVLAAQCIVDLYQGRLPEPCIVNKSLIGTWKW